jgi:hypothetical protein
MGIKLTHNKEGYVVAIDTETNKEIGIVTSIENNIEKNNDAK